MKTREQFDFDEKCKGSNNSYVNEAINAWRQIAYNPSPSNLSHLRSHYHMTLKTNLANG